MSQGLETTHQKNTISTHAQMLDSCGTVFASFSPPFNALNDCPGHFSTASAYDIGWINMLSKVNHRVAQAFLFVSSTQYLVALLPHQSVYELIKG